MSQSQGIEVRRPSRRTIATGAAWAVPVIAVGASAPAFAASPNECVPEFTVVPTESTKCCDDGSLKNMKLTIQVTDVNDCLPQGSVVCVDNIRLGNGQNIGSIVDQNGDPALPECVAVDATFTVFLLDVNSCTVNLEVDYSIGGVANSTELKSGNIPDGNSAAACVPPPS